MFCSKKGLFVFLSIITLQMTHAAYLSEWKNMPSEKGNVRLDVKSINIQNDSLHYAVYYFDVNNNEEVVAIIESKGDKAGIIKTYKYADYAKMNEHPAFSNEKATNLIEVKEGSLLYLPNKYAISISDFTNNKKNTVALNDEFWKYYMKGVQEKISKNWKPPSGYPSADVIVVFVINKYGELVSQKIKKSSGNQEIDCAAKMAIINSAPFRSLGLETTEDYIPIEFTFEYNGKGR